jgi:hypothetical protein
MVYNKLHKEHIDANQLVLQQTRRILLSAIARHHIDIWKGAKWGSPGLSSPQLAFDTLEASSGTALYMARSAGRGLLRICRTVRALR